MEKGAAPFGEVLKLRRVASGISQERLAERAGMSASAVSALERGVRRAPYRETVALLSSALGLTPEEQAELEEAAERARGRSSRAAGEPPLVHNLPTRLTSFVGRGEEIAELKELLSEHRLLTVSGSGGVGKTRFAVETARQLLGERFPEVRFVDLSPIEDGAFVPSAIAAALDVQLPGGAEPLRALASSIKTRTLLLILDNCEHVIDDAASAIGEILRGCPSITILATSRERIALEGECVYRLPSLAVPDDVPATIEEACTYASFRLFVERAMSSDGHFTPTASASRAVSEICRRLEGIPLALELAATRLPLLGLETLNERLKGHFLITSGARDLPQRQQTMLATIAWSYDLLSAQEQHLLGRLAVFRGGITLEGATAVCKDHVVAAEAVPDLLALLVDKSLLFPTPGERRRFMMLESVREFASSKLREAGEFDAAARAHAAWLATAADRANELVDTLPYEQWYAEYGPELDNIRAALEWCLNSETEADVVIAARILGGLRVLWLRYFKLAECAEWSTAILDRLDVERYPLVAALVMKAEFYAAAGTAQEKALKRAIPLFEKLGDFETLTTIYAVFANFYSRASSFDEADRFIEKAFALADQEKLEQTDRYFVLLQLRSNVHLRAGRLDEARKDFSRATQLRRRLTKRADSYIDLYWEAQIEFAAGSVERSIELFESAIAAQNLMGVENSGAWCGLSVAHLVLKNIPAAARAAREMLNWSIDYATFPYVIAASAVVAAVYRQPQAAARLFGFARSQVDIYFDSPTERVGVDILISALREQLSPEAVEELMAEGAKLDHDRVREEALSL